MKKLVILLALVVLATIVPPVAAGGPGDVEVFGQNYTLGEDDKIEGDLRVFGGNVELLRGSQVDGDVQVFGGNLTVYGEVKGDIVVWGGNVRLKDGAIIRGDVVAMGGDVEREAKCDMRGEMMSRTGVSGLPMLPFVPGMTHPYPRLWGSNLLHRVGMVFRGAFGTLTTIVLGVLVVVFLPRHTETVAETMLKAPLYSLVSGAVALVASAAAFLIVSLVAGLLALTICLAPVSLLLFLPFLIVGIGLLFGWIAAGLLLGTKVLRTLTRHEEPGQILAVALGILLLSIISSVPCVGWAAAVAVVTWSLGAVVYSLFGTRAYDEPAPRILGEMRYDPRVDRL